MTASSDPSWRAEAACLTIGGDIFHTPDTTDNEERLAPHHYYAAAQAICARCPVTAQCLDVAMTMEQGRSRKTRYGVWGGLTPRQRAELAGPLPSRAVGRVKSTAPHGTEARANVHKRQEEPVCEECRLAQNAAKRRRKAAVRAAKKAAA